MYDRRVQARAAGGDVLTVRQRVALMIEWPRTPSPLCPRFMALAELAGGRGAAVRGAGGHSPVAASVAARLETLFGRRL